MTNYENESEFRYTTKIIIFYIVMMVVPVPILMYVRVYKETTESNAKKDMIINEQKKVIEDYSKTISENNIEIENKNNEIENMRNLCINDATLLLELIEPLKNSDKIGYLSKYNFIINKYSEVIDEPETLEDCFTKEQIKIMWKAIETETFQCDFDSKVNVACVILNRVENDMFPTDPIEIITKTNQFSYGRNIITEETKLALEYAFEVEDTTNGCIGFRSDVCPKVWNGWKYQFSDGKHYFYK